MNKAFRQGQIVKLIRNKRILTQEDLARELKLSQGIDTTQVTLSRDIRDLGLLKTPEGYRQVESATPAPDVETIAGELLQDVRIAQNLIVLRTSPGNANALAVALDKAGHGLRDCRDHRGATDTILIVTPDTGWFSTDSLPQAARVCSTGITALYGHGLSLDGPTKSPSLTEPRPKEVVNVTRSVQNRDREGGGAPTTYR